MKKAMLHEHLSDIWCKEESICSLFNVVCGLTSCAAATISPKAPE